MRISDWSSDVCSSDLAVRISHVVESLNRGGLERVVIDLAMAQSAAGHDCQVVCLFEAGAMVTELAAAGVPVITCNKRDGADLRAVLRMRRAIASHGTEVLPRPNGIAHHSAPLAAFGLGGRRAWQSGVWGKGEAGR